ncbi:hypothetical protein [Magnetovibrio sp.]|uniref:hypothetical protein n=1 Tax=Magnetovibrio sp. TaxID=2024836 RepID=UPI002F95741B
MSDNDLVENTAKLKIFALVADSYRVVFGNPGTMVRILWLPMALMGIVNFRFQDRNFQDLNAALQVDTDPAALQAQLDAAFDPMFFIYMLVSWVVMCAVFVSLHRFVLLGEQPPTLGFTVRKREWRYLGYVIAILVTASVAMFVSMMGLIILELLVSALVGTEGAMVGILFFMVVLVLMVISVTIYVRLGFVLPTIALDQEGGVRRRFKGAWALAKGNTLRMFVALFVASLPYMLIFGIWSYAFMQSVAEAMAMGSGFEPNMIITMVVFGVISWLWYGVTIAMYSIAYRTLEPVGPQQQVET